MISEFIDEENAFEEQEEPCSVGSGWLAWFGREQCALKEMCSQWQINKYVELSELPLGIPCSRLGWTAKTLEKLQRTYKWEAMWNLLSSDPLSYRTSSAEAVRQLKLVVAGGTAKGWTMVAFAGASSDFYPRHYSPGTPSVPHPWDFC